MALWMCGKNNVMLFKICRQTKTYEGIYFNQGYDMRSYLLSFLVPVGPEPLGVFVNLSTWYLQTCIFVINNIDWINMQYQSTNFDKIFT